MGNREFTMPISDPTGTTVVELSRAEQWVVHHVLLDAIGLAAGDVDEAIEDADDAGPSLGAIEKLESGSFQFTADELAFIRRACGAHASATEAVADRNLASSVAERIDLVLDDVTA